MTKTMTCPRCWAKSKNCPVCAGKGKVPDVQLSPNFWLSEFVGSEKAQILRLPNDPPPSVVDNLRRLCAEALEPIRALSGPLEINSGYRAPDVNKAVGGSSTSAHCFGLAADVDPVKGTWRQLMDRIIDSGIALDQLIYEHTWVHIGLLHPRTMSKRGELLAMVKKGGKIDYISYSKSDYDVA